MHEGEKGSGITLRIFDWRTIGFPFLFPDLAALRARIASEASVWKKWPGSVDRDIVWTVAYQQENSKIVYVLGSALLLGLLHYTLAILPGAVRSTERESVSKVASSKVQREDLRRTSQIQAKAIDNLNMATTTQMRLRPRPAHTRGPTYLSYTPDGTKLITVGSNNTTRVYKTGYDGEPTNIDDCPEQNTGVASTVCASLPGI
jgi:WD40 repeat protein